ncbi:helix-turn-helix domain-containing protein [Micromonospora sp. NBC_01796]|uniref:helix-turn-helix domain-containing protein n=1 Tax=Micromonospora sp. NBC_01796 TaxID=2975987 RepID=UPI002DDA344B|nr:helix-turn-helix transcriptional regulator [Micromonospora sp. NBC_01796]WSA86554.1 helix-turn-helix domain-containing protein [Micromonospora sp. NBC_01796]
MRIGPEQTVPSASTGPAPRRVVRVPASRVAATVGSPPAATGPTPPPLLRRLIGSVLRRVRLRQGRTLRDVARMAGVSVPYLSEVERGRKEPSSEVLAAICRALGLHLADLLEQVRDDLSRIEPARPVGPPRAGAPSSGGPAREISCAVSGSPDSRNRSLRPRRRGRLHESVIRASTSPAGRAGGGIYERAQGVDARRGAGLVRRSGLRPVAAGTDHLPRY